MSRELMNFSLDIKEEACSGTQGAYYLAVAEMPMSTRLHEHQIFLGREPIDGGEAALDVADRYLAGLVTDEFDHHKNAHASAASLLRLCTRHEEPVLEVADTTIVTMPAAGRRDVDGEYMYYQSGLFTHVSAKLVPTDDDKYSGFRDREKVYYMPHAGYDATQQDHPSVIAYAGGSSYPMRIGLLGGEQVIEREPFPVVGNDYY